MGINTSIPGIEISATLLPTCPPGIGTFHRNVTVIWVRVPSFFPHQKAPPPDGGERSGFSRNPSPAPAIFRRQDSMILWLLPVCALGAVTFHRNVTVTWVRVLSFFRTKRLPHRMVGEPFGAGDRTRTCTAKPEEPKGDVTLVNVFRSRQKIFKRYMTTIFTIFV